jgi:hypothetical protein
VLGEKICHKRIIHKALYSEERVSLAFSFKDTLHPGEPTLELLIKKKTHNSCCLTHRICQGDDLFDSPPDCPSWRWTLNWPHVEDTEKRISNNKTCQWLNEDHQICHQAAWIRRQVSTITCSYPATLSLEPSLILWLWSSQSRLTQTLSKTKLKHFCKCLNG